MAGLGSTIGVLISGLIVGVAESLAMSYWYPRARVLVLNPEIILLDEPTSALDPVSTKKIESLLYELSSTITIVLAPHNTQQSARMADYAAFFLQGEVVEFGLGEKLFLKPVDQRTQDYLAGRFG